MLKRLQPGQAPAWGKMTAQHMVEHLTSSVLVSTIVSTKPASPPSDQQRLVKEGLIYSRAAFPRNVNNPAFQFGLPAYAHPDLETAKQKLLASLPVFFRTYAVKKDAVSFSPFLGDLTFDELLVLHVKHFRHHLTQFNLLKSATGCCRAQLVVKQFFYKLGQQGLARKRPF